MKKKKQDIDDVGPEMKKFTCATCNKEFGDTKLYFFGIPSKRCVQCTKFPEKKKRTFT